MTPSARVAVVIGGAVGLLAVGYLGAALAFADEVPRGGRVAGVDVGGLDRARAVARVQSAAQGQGQPLTLKAGDRTATLDRVFWQLTKQFKRFEVGGGKSTRTRTGFDQSDESIVAQEDCSCADCDPTQAVDGS